MRSSLTLSGQGEPLLRVEGLTVELEGRVQPAVRNLSFELMPGRLVGLVGESGSGKSLTGLSVLRLLPQQARQAAGHIWLGEQDLCALSEPEMCRVRGSRVAMAFQDASEALSPVHTVGWHLYTALRSGKLLPPLLRSENSSKARTQLLESLQRVEMEDPEAALLNYPQQLPSGAQERLLLAIALAQRPELLVLDDPGRNLDASARSQLMAIVQRQVDDDQLCALLITNDLPLALESTSEVLVMHAGEIVERAHPRTLLRGPQHPYSVQLVKAMREPLFDPPHAPGELPPTLDACSYYQYCWRRAAHLSATPRCQEAPELGPASAKHQARCHYPHLDD